MTNRNYSNANASAAEGSSTDVRTDSPDISQKLNVLQLTMLVFYTVSGGPFGIEPALRASGNLFTILGFALFPFIWSLPEALVTAELGSTFKCSSGGVIWVQAAFGESAGALCGFFNWVSGATDNAIYPALFLTYLVGDTLPGFTRFIYVSAITLVLAWFNYLGLDIVGNASFVVCIISMSPFIIMVVLGAGKVDPSRWLQLPLNPFSQNRDSQSGPCIFDDDFETSPGALPLISFGIFLRPYLHNLFWNLNSFDSAASFADEVRDIKTTYPRGIFLGLVLSCVLYLVPILLVTGATDYSQADWVDGHMATAASDIGGMWLGGWTVFAIGISNLALFEAEMSGDVYQLMGMAQKGYLPSFFKNRSKYGTPTAGILTGTIVIIILSVADFGQLVELLNANYAIALLMEYAAFVKLRLCRKDLERPYRVPIPDVASIFLVLPPCLGILLVLAISSWLTYIFVVVMSIVALGLISMMNFLRERGCCEFEIISPVESEVNEENDDRSTMEESGLDSLFEHTSGEEAQLVSNDNEII